MQQNAQRRWSCGISFVQESAAEKTAVLKLKLSKSVKKIESGSEICLSFLFLWQICQPVDAHFYSRCKVTPLESNSSQYSFRFFLSLVARILSIEGNRNFFEKSGREYNSCRVFTLLERNRCTRSCGRDSSS